MNGRFSLVPHLDEVIHCAYVYGLLRPGKIAKCCAACNQLGVQREEGAESSVDVLETASRLGRMREDKRADSANHDSGVWVNQTVGGRLGSRNFGAAETQGTGQLTLSKE